MLHAGFDLLEDPTISTLKMSVGDLDRHKSIVKLNVPVGTEVLEVFACEFRAILGDDAMGDAKRWMRLRMNSNIYFNMVMATGLTSIHFLNLSTTTKRWV